MATPTLLDYWANQLIAPIVGKGLFSRDRVRLSDYIQRAQMLYETGAVLGQMFRDRLPVLVELFCEPGREAATVASLAESATSQMAHVKKEPKDFLDLFFKPEVERLMKIMRDDGRTGFTDWADFPKLSRKKMRRGLLLTGLEVAAWKGIALGGRYPELTEKLLSVRPDEETWRQFRARSSFLPVSPPLPKPIRERHAEAIAMLRPYAEKFRPDLVARLGLWPETSSDFQQRFRAIRARQADEG